MDGRKIFELARDFMDGRKIFELARDFMIYIDRRLVIYIFL